MNTEINILSDKIVDEVERLLPDILNQLKIDEKSIKYAERKEQFKMGRTKKKQRKASPKVIEKRDNFFFINNLKQHIGYFDGKNNMKTDYYRNLYISDSNIVPIEHKILDHNYSNGHKLSVNDSQIIKRMMESLNYEFLTELDKMNITKEDIPSILFFEKEIESIPTIKIGNLLKKEIKRNAILSEVIRSINTSIKDLIEKYDLEMKVYIEQKEDIEYNDWKKIYYHFSFYSESFDDKIEIWDKLDDFIRLKINEIKSKRYRLGEKSRIVNNIEKNLYIDIDL